MSSMTTDDRSSGAPPSTTPETSARGLTLIARKVPAGRPGAASAAATAAASSSAPSPTRCACANHSSGGRASGLQAGERLVAADATGRELEHGLEERHDHTGRLEQRLDLHALLARRAGAGRGARGSGRSGGGRRPWPRRARRRRRRAARRRRPRRPDARRRPPSTPAAVPPTHDLGDRGARPLGDLARLRGVHPRQHEHELLAAEAPDRVRSRTTERRRLAGAARTRSPSAWPCRSLTRLKWSRSSTTTLTGRRRTPRGPRAGAPGSHGG